jgi:hypothetical protein
MEDAGGALCACVQEVLGSDPSRDIPFKIFIWSTFVYIFPCNVKSEVETLSLNNLR